MLIFTVTPSDQRYSRLTSKFQIVFKRNTKVIFFSFDFLVYANTMFVLVWSRKFAISVFRYFGVATI